jgi:outer membrane protein OmpA-like peptidoglycan-associated protein
MIGDYAIPTKKKAAAKRVQKTSDISSIPVTNNEPLLLESGVLFPSNILFKLDEWKLKHEAKKELSEVHDMYNQSMDKDILIEGHTCSLGKETYNMELSRKRAQSVADYFVNTIGISKDFIRIRYYGEKSPIAPNNIKEGREKNRRVKMQFVPRVSKEGELDV